MSDNTAVSNLGGGAIIPLGRIGNAPGLDKAMRGAQRWRFALTPEQVMAVEDGPVNRMGAFDLIAAMQKNQAQIDGSFATGDGVAPGNLPCMLCATARFFRPSCQNNLVQPSACVQYLIAPRHPAAGPCSGGAS